MDLLPEVNNKISGLMPGKVIDKKAVAFSFSRAAQSYDEVAKIQQWVIAELVANFKSHSNGQALLDIGCGTGYFSLQCAKVLNPQFIAGLDIAEGMLKVSKEKISQNLELENAFNAVCGDAEAIPFAQNCFDMVISSFALQWCPDLYAVFNEVNRVLHDGGKFYFALPIGKTLHELKRCWYQVDPGNTHVNDFYSGIDIEMAAKQAGFKSIDVTVQQYQEHYPDLKSLTSALKAMGAHNVTPGRARQLTGKQKIKRLINQYEAFRVEQGLPATWEVAFGSLEK